LKRVLSAPFTDRVSGAQAAWRLVLSIGVVAAFIFWLIRLALTPWVQSEAPFALIFGGIATAAVLGGWRSGLVALVVGNLLVWWSILEPRWLFSYKDSDWGNALVVAIASQAVLLGAITVYQREVRRAWGARDEVDRRRDALVAELNHRVKNTLAIVVSIARQTFSAARGLNAVESFEGRIQNLAASHDLLTERDWLPTTIGEVIERALRPFYSEAAFTIRGPAFSVLPKTAVSLSLGLHELATNAVKHGALTAAEGEVVVEWSLHDDGSFKLIWTERGGPPVNAPKRRGFGTRMIETGLAMELGGTVRITFGNPGLVCEMTSNKAVVRHH
jgi:two-component sensor histidine kinase